MNVKNLFRKVSVIGAFAMACVAIPMTVYAGYATTVIGDGGVYLDGYINGVEGILCFQDQVNYNAFLYGDEYEIAYIYDQVAVRAGTDKNKHGIVYLYDGNEYVSETNVKLGCGGTRAELEMKCFGARETISVALD